MNANYTDIAESVNKEFTPQYRGILEDTDIFPLNKLFARIYYEDTIRLFGSLDRQGIPLL